MVLYLVEINNFPMIYYDTVRQSFLFDDRGIL